MDYHSRQAAKAVIAHISACRRELAPSFQTFIKNFCQHESRDLIARAVLDFARHHHLPGVPEAKQPVMRIGETLPSQKVRARIVDALMKKADSDPEAALEILNVPGRTGMGEDADMSALMSYLHRIAAERDGKSVGDSPSNSLKQKSPVSAKTDEPEAPKKTVPTGPILAETKSYISGPTNTPEPPENSHLSKHEATKAPTALVGRALSTPSNTPSNQPNSTLSKRRRKQDHITVKEAASVEAKLNLAEEKGITFTVALVLNHAAIPGYEADHKSTEAQRRAAQQKAGRVISDALTKFSRRCKSGPFDLEYISVWEMADGVGSHENRLINLPATTEHVQELSAFLMRLFNETPESMTEHRRKAAAAKRKGKTYRGAPFSIRAGKHDLIHNPGAGFMTTQDVRCFASYPLKSLPNETLITWNGITTTAANHRQAGRMHAYEEPGRILQRQVIRSSRNLSNKATAAAGIIPDISLSWLCSRTPAQPKPRTVTPDSAPSFLSLIAKGHTTDEATAIREASPGFVPRKAINRRPRTPETSQKTADYGIISLESEAT